ncbi:MULTISPECIES: copper resistance protein NlpE N-terminal domain-containing protein [unclassified Luteimonas]|uniref:copper resistance protein NlpE N-terminal domain-containing protein n=1 Tax=unclassified Luteimonas TaxID=2629088 RepID=UPI00160199FB|nr:MULTISPECIES: copper resistance protein NlpE N-terminal domain-containing protein [unclassified Luteimonas]MBB1473592.1 copper resistance protein NlpE N-terminal domain-containing protein [Luteimonas sp. MC1782]MBB6600193.1 copper resistance protein NlpE N-terminal domain-containing protein [Luteimonas sp. MC1825]QOC87882.1 copper resistance protein NlpE N-terminal domain-containing protein [Luteimonas sp. MC1825]
MARLPAVLLILLALASAGCEPARGPDAQLPALGGVDGRIEWRGTLPCADCEGIDTQLVLERQGEARQYALVEVYIALDGSMRFEETGAWRLDDALLSLEPATGGLRRYALQRDGTLQARDAAGMAFPGREGDILQPAAARP